MPLRRLAPLRDMTVLLAEDDAQARESLARVLRLFFGHVLEARDGREALDLFRAKIVHLVILDIVMPGHNGLDVAARLRKADADLPVLMLTGHNEPEFMQQAVRLRLMDYLIKPVQLESLESALVRCLEEMRTRDRLVARLAPGVLFNPVTGAARVAGRPVTLTARERQLLGYLLPRRGKWVEAGQICLDMASDGELSPEALRNLISRLRSKIGADAVLSSRDLGYRIPAADKGPG